MPELVYHAGVLAEVLPQNDYGVSVALSRRRDFHRLVAGESLTARALTEDAFAAAAALRSPLANRAKAVLQQLRLELSKVDGHDLPRVQTTSADDGSFLIEWIFLDRRLGFAIEESEGESGWFFVSSRESGGHCSSGDLAHMDLAQLVAQTLKTR
jgi:hypothetical protein